MVACTQGAKQNGKGRAIEERNKRSKQSFGAVEIKGLEFLSSPNRTKPMLGDGHVKQCLFTRGSCDALLSV